MKIIKNMLTVSDTNKTMQNFLNDLDRNTMIKVKGGGEPLWPPTVKGEAN